MRHWRAFAALLVAPLALNCLGPGESEARADPPVSTVVLLQPAKSDPVTAEAMVRVKGELSAAGFDVAVIALSRDNAKGDLETAGRALNAIAAFALFVTPSDGGASVAEIWVSDRIHHKTIVENALLLETDRGRGSEILAVRAVELLKASLADVWSASAPGPAIVAETPPPRPVLSARAANQERRAPFAAGVSAAIGVGFMDDFRVRGTWAPAVMASYGWRLGFGLRATLVGWAQTAVTLSSDKGSATVEQQLAMFEAVKTWWPRAALVPFVFAGTGAQHLQITGKGTPPYRGHASDDWSLLTTIGMGLGLPIVSVLSLVADARALAAWPSSVVQIADAQAGRLGTPSLLIDAGLSGALP